MIKVERLIEELQKFPQGSRAYAHEGEITGIVVVNDDDDEIGYINCSSDKFEFECEAIFLNPEDK